MVVPNTSPIHHLHGMIKFDVSHARRQKVDHAEAIKIDRIFVGRSETGNVLVIKERVGEAIHFKRNLHLAAEDSNLKQLHHDIVNRV